MDPFVFTTAAVAVAGVMARVLAKSNVAVTAIPPDPELQAILRHHSAFAALSEATQRRVAAALADAARRTGTDLLHLVALVDIESDFTPTADNGTAYGIGQQLPVYSGYFSDACWDDARRAARCSASDSRRHNLTPAQLKSDVEQAARIAARNIGHLIRQYGVREGAGRYFAGSNHDVPAAVRYSDAFEREMREWAPLLRGR